MSTIPARIATIFITKVKKLNGTKSVPVSRIRKCLKKNLVHHSIEQRNFGKNWKAQLVQPLDKKKERTSVENYRPVSNMVKVGKVTEYALA